MRKIISVLLGMLLAAVVFSCDLMREEVVFTGRTMGTTYQVKIVTGYFSKPKGLEQKVETRLAEINQSMSTYLPKGRLFETYNVGYMLSVSSQRSSSNTL